MSHALHKKSRLCPAHAQERCRALLGLVCAVLICGCARQSPQPAQNTLRLVSTAPNITECVCAIGAGSLLVGRTESCDYPPEEVRHIPITGGFGTPWMEALLARQPSHVLETILADPAIISRLNQLSIPIIHVNANRLTQIPTALRQLGQLTGNVAQAEALAHQIQTGLEQAHKEVSAATNQPPRVLLLFAPDTPITAGRHTFISEMLELAGGHNLGRDITTDYYHVSLEWILTQDPDIILCVFETQGRAPRSFFDTAMGWKSLRAVSTGRVYALSDLGAVSRPGPRVLSGLAQLKQLLAHDAQHCHKNALLIKKPVHTAAER